MFVEIMIVCSTIVFIAFCSYFKYPVFLKRFSATLLTVGLIALGITFEEEPTDTQQVGYFLIVIAGGLVSAAAAVFVKASDT